MPKFKDSYYFDAPAEIVWDASTDFELWASLTGLKVKNITDGPFAVGTRWIETRKAMGHDSSQEWEITRVDEPTSYRAISDSMGAHWVYDQYLVADGDGTRLFVDFDIVPNRLGSKLGFGAAWPFMSVMMRRGIAKDFGTLADVCAKRAREAG